MRGEGGEAGEGRGAAPHPGQHPDQGSPPPVHTQGAIDISSHYLTSTQCF